MVINFQIYDRVDKNKDYQEFIDVKIIEKYIYMYDEFK